MAQTLHYGEGFCGGQVIPLILREQEPSLWEFHRTGKAAKYHVADPVMCVNSYELCVAAVRSALGAAMLVKLVIQKDIDTGTIVEILPDWKVDPIPVSLVVQLSRLRRPEVMAVAKHLVSKLATRPPSSG